MTRRGRGRERGFTLIELMIATFLLTLVVGMTLQLAFTMVEGFRTQRAALAIERNARGSIDVLASAVRGASTGVVTGDLRDSDNCTDVTAIKVINATDGPDRLRLIYGVPGAITSTRAVVTGTTTTIKIADSTGLAAGDQVIVSNGDIGRVFPVNSLGTSGTDDTIGTALGGCAGMTIPSFAAGSLVVRARVADIYIADAADGTPMLMMDPDGDGDRPGEPIAEGIEDFQVAVGVDADGDGNLTDNDDTSDEWYYNVDGDSDPPSITGGKWRALRITIVARDVNLSGSSNVSAPPAAEDHAGGPLDEHRRRVLSTTVEIRNFIQGTP